MRTGVPIIPCSVVGAEEIYPLVGNIPSLARLLGVPYIPITPFFPLLGPLGLVPLPSKWLIEFGEPIRTDSYDEGAADDPMLVFNVTDQVRETIQQTLYTLLMQRRVGLRPLIRALSGVGGRAEVRSVAWPRQRRRRPATAPTVPAPTSAVGSRSPCRPQGARVDGVRPGAASTVAVLPLPGVVPPAPRQVRRAAAG